MTTFNIPKLSTELDTQIQSKIDLKTKPPGSLGQLESLAFKLAKIQQTLKPKILNPGIIVFAGDHGLSDENVSPYPKEVTTQMVLNFLNEGAAINAFANLHNIPLKVVDAGVCGELPPHKNLLQLSEAKGTKNSLKEPAISRDQLKSLFQKAKSLIEKQLQEGTDLFIFGEMGIGNTSAASLIMSQICQIPLIDCIGRGTGLDDEGLKHKEIILNKVLERHTECSNQPFDILTSFGGFEIAMITSAMLTCAENKTPFLVDGFIVTSALLIAHAHNPHVLDYAIFSHCSDESGHQHMLKYLKAEPLLNLNLRLGEGSGATLAYPFVQAALAFFNNMASFKEASVSNRD